VLVRLEDDRWVNINDLVFGDYTIVAWDPDALDVIRSDPVQAEREMR
jgi:hypothetical protein